MSPFNKLISWSKEHYSHLPWRKNRTLYRTLVSEIMLQQTTVSTVLNHFERFLEKYPTIHHLAKANEHEILIAWKGLGYYRRAKNLLSIAKQIEDKFSGNIPTDLDKLINLKGVGPYTANAILAIGADKRALALDANLERVLARYLGIDLPKGAKLNKEIYHLFNEKKILKNLEGQSPREINEALMDLGRVVCQARKASCNLCALKKECKAYSLNAPLDYPREDKTKEKKKSVEHELILIRFVVLKKNSLLIYQKKDTQWLSGQWELPTFVISSTDKKLDQYPTLIKKVKFEKLPQLKTSITKYNIKNYIYECEEKDFLKIMTNTKDNYTFKKISKDLNLSTASLKILKKCAIEL